MNEQSTPGLVVVMPIYNEEANISDVISEWLPALEASGRPFQLLAIDDGSKDHTLEILGKLACEHPGKVVVVSKTNSGHGRTCRHGYELALQSGAEWVLQIDSDGQCDPGYFAQFWSHTPQADCVFGFRKTRGDGLARKIISRTCGFLSSLVAGAALQDANVPYRLMRTEALARALDKVPADFDVQNIALSVALKRCPNLRWAYVPIHFRDRQGGINSINIRKIAAMGWKMLRELRRVKP